MNANLYAAAFILPGAIQMDPRLRELLERYDTSNEFQEDFGIRPYLDLAPLFLSAGGSIATAPVAGEKDTVFSYQLLLRDGQEAEFYSMLETILDELFLPKEPTTIQEYPDPKRRFQVLEGGRAHG